MARYKTRQQNRKGDRACDACGCVRPLVEHHINGRISNARWNTCFICPNCHDDVHGVPPRLVISRWALTSTGRELLTENTVATTGRELLTQN